MANCKPVCSLCQNLYISDSVTFTGGNLVINIPQTSIRNGDKACFVIAQPIPDTTTINAPVVISIGGGTELYPLTTKMCRAVTACGVRTRTRYSTCLTTNATGGTFRMLGQPCCSPNNQLTAIDGTAPAATPAGGGGTTPTT